MSSKRHGGKKSQKDEVELDPIFTTVHQSLEETVTYFMANLSEYLARYSEKLRIAMPHNPKACHYYYDPTEDIAKPVPSRESVSVSRAEAEASVGDGQVKGVPPEDPSGPRKVKRGDRSESPPRRVPTSPLLRRPKLDPAVAAEVEAQHLNMYNPIGSHGESFKFPTPLPPAAAANNDAPSGLSPGSRGAEVPAEEEGAGDSGGIGGAAKTDAPTTGAAPSKDGGEITLTDAELWAQMIPPPLLLEQLGAIKQEARLLWRTFDRIHDWLALSIPRMQEEDNSGVGVMAAVISEVSEIIGLAKQIYALELKYLNERSEIESKVVKYQGADSYQKGLAVYDANTWDDIERGWRSLMRGVLLAHNVLAKNMKVLKEPRKKQGHYMMMAL